MFALSIDVRVDESSILELMAEEDRKDGRNLMGFGRKVFISVVCLRVQISAPIKVKYIYIYINYFSACVCVIYPASWARDGQNKRGRRRKSNITELLTLTKESGPCRRAESWPSQRGAFPFPSSSSSSLLHFTL